MLHQPLGVVNGFLYCPELGVVLPVVLVLAKTGLILFLVGVAVLCVLDLVCTVCTGMKVCKVHGKKFKISQKIWPEISLKNTNFLYFSSPCR